MGKLVEICNSTYSHMDLTSFGKKYYRHRFKDKIICEECLNAYLDMTSKMLAWEIFNCTKNVNMQAMILTADVNRSDSFSFNYEKSVNNNFMQYILPISFKLSISFNYEKLKEYNKSEDDYNTLSTAIAANSPLTATRIARVNITPIVCDSSYPAFNLYLDIRENDVEEVISSRIELYLRSFIASFFMELPELIIQTLMDKKGSTEYSSSCSAATTAPACSKCSVDVSNEQYIYNNKLYCLDCMYDIIVQSSIDNNITDLVGLSSTGSTTTHYAIVNSVDWKRSIIDKYINAMRSFGVNPNITHVRMTLYS